MEEVETLIQKLELDKLKECQEEMPEPGLYVLIKSDCVVELPEEIPRPLKLSPIVGSILLFNPAPFNSLDTRLTEDSMTSLNPENLNSLIPQIVLDISVEKQVT
jgi:hypothetical protein